MSVIEAKLEPGWLKKQMADIAALQRAHKKIIRADDARRRNGYTQPCSIELTVSELSALAHMIRLTGLVY